MKHASARQKSHIRQTHFPLSVFTAFLLLLLLMSGLHTGILVLMNKLGWNEWLQTLTPMIYWATVALGLTFFTHQRMKQTYEIPMQLLAQATAKVAGGDFSVFVAPIHTADKLDYLDVMIMDFNKMVEALGSIETLKTDFFSNVSHEFKTPLAVIQSNAELLCKNSLPESSRRESAETILHAARRLSSLITNMLKLNKLEKQVIPAMPESFDLCAQLCECALQFERLWESKGITFIADLEDRAFIEADKGLLELVWSNLLSNAIKFTPTGGTVTLTQTSDAGEMQISVSDSGCGMHEETIRHMFDQFYQSDVSHSTEGNGLGLTLVQRILQLLEGDITVISSPGAGSTFTVRLPLSLRAKELS